MAEQSLKDKTVKGTIWSGIDNFVQIGVAFVVSIVLARLLTPDDYGLIGIVAIFTTICNALINGGFNSALIRKKNATEDDYNTSFIVNLSVSVLLYIIVFFLAPLIADFFGRKELISLTRTSTLVMVIGALAMVQQTLLTKRVDFKTQTKITLIASLVSGSVGIGMALLRYGVWSLVAQQLLAQALKTLLFFFYNNWMPKLKFSVNSFHELFGFGWKMMLSQLIDSIWKELYQTVVGKYYSPATLGQYTRAKQFASLLSQNLTSVVQRVTYPVLSSIQDDRERMVYAYRRIIKITMFVTAIGMFFLGAISEPLLYCLIGPKWHEAAIYLPLICINGSLYPLHAINLNMLQVQGRSDLFLGIEILKKIVGLAPLFVGALVGILPMLYVNLITGLINFFLNSHYSGKFLGYSSLMQLRDVASSYLLAIVVSIAVFFLKYLPISNWIILPLQIVVGIMVLLLVCIVTKNTNYLEVKTMVKTSVNKIRKRS